MKYKGTLSFETDRELTTEQIDQLAEMIHLQIQEPQDQNQEQEEYTTFSSVVNVAMINEKEGK